MSKNSLIQSTIILTSASLFTRVIGFFYRIYMNKELGAYKMGLYQLLIPVYMLAWSLICSGFTTTISKLSSEYQSTKDYIALKKLLKYSLLFSFITGMLTMIATLSFTDFIVLQFLKEEELYTPLQLISLSFPFMAIGSCIRGYFLGLQKAETPSKSQVLEQLSRIGFIMLFVYLHGELTINIAILGITIGEIISCTYVVLKYFSYKNKIDTTSIIPLSKSKNTVVISSIFISALPLTLNRVIHSLLHTVENVLINNSLVLYGFSRDEALAEFGKITGLTFPLVYFPTTIILSISISLLASISSLKAKNNHSKINDLLEKVFTFAIILGSFFASIFVVFSEELGVLLYNTDISLYLFFFGLASPLIYLQMIYGGILNGLGKQFTLFVNSTVSSLIIILSIYLLVPKVGILGFLVAFLLSVLYCNFAHFNKIKSEVALSFSLVKLSIKPVVIGILTTIGMLYFKSNLTITTELLHLVLLGLILLCMFSILLICFGIISLKDIKRVLKLVKSRVKLEKNIYTL